MTGAVDRMIAGARAPKMGVRPLLPSRYEPDGHQGAGGAPWTPEDLQESYAAPVGGPVSPARSERAREVGGTRQEQGESASLRVLQNAAEASFELDHPVPALGALRDAPAAARPAETARADATAPAPSGTADGPRPPGWGERRVVPAPAAAPQAEAHTREERVIVERPAALRAAARQERPAAAATARQRVAAAAEVRLGTTEVSISIGHIEVRAVPAPEPRRAPAARPRVTLEEFLRSRDGRRR